MASLDKLYDETFASLGVLTLESEANKALDKQALAALSKHNAEQHLEKLRDNPPMQDAIATPPPKPGPPPGPPGNGLGLPIAGDFNGEGIDDTAIFNAPLWRLDLGVGAALDSEPVFTLPNQGLFTQDRFFIEASLLRALPKPIFEGWQSNVQISYTYGQMDQNGHFNVVGGATGPSTGNVHFNALTAGLGFEKQISDVASLGFDFGTGLADFRFTGAFNGGGTVPVVTVGGHLLGKITNKVSGGPFAKVIFPLDSPTGTTGGSGSITIDPLILVGINLRFGLGR